MTDRDDEITRNFAVLRSLPFLRIVGSETLARLAEVSRRRRFGRRDALCCEGQPCPGIWIVLEGAIQSTKLAPGGRGRVLETIRGEGTCALGAALSPEESCDLHVEAREDATVLLVPQAALIELARTDPALGVAIAQGMGARFRATCQLVSLALSDVKTRIAVFLLEEASRSGVAGDGGTVSFVLPAPQGELARELGTEREVFARALRTLREEGIVEHRRDHVVIHDLARLRAIASAD